MVNLQTCCVSALSAPHAWRGIKVHFHILILLELKLNIMKDHWGRAKFVCYNEVSLHHGS